jgi:hypothetical protein
LNQADYWVIYVLNVFQMNLILDHDPATEKSLLGVTGFSSSPDGRQTTRNYINLALETYRDQCGALSSAAGARDGVEAAVVHEIGHAFGGEHRRGDRDGGIMTVTKCSSNNTQFSGTSLNKMRSGSMPGTYKAQLTNPSLSGF